MRFIKSRSIKSRGYIIVCILAIFLFVVSSFVRADDVYVDQRNETGPWDGTIEHPYQSIQQAIDETLTFDGDNIRVADGIYEEGIVVDKFLKIYGSGPDVTTIDTTVTGEDSAVVVEANKEVTISGFTIASPRYGIQIGSYSETVIANNVIHSEYGIYSYAPSTTLVIKNNTINQCIKDGIRLSGSSSASHITATIYNNIITSNDAYGIYVYRTTLSNSYNDVWDNGTNYYGCSAGPGSISENPRFVDPSTGNYRLQITSPCIDKGWPIKTELDPDGTRNNMGAYGGPGAAIFWPDAPGAPVVTNLTVTPAAVPTDGTVTIKAIGRVRPYSNGQE